MDYLKIQSTFMQHTKRVDYLFSMDYSPEKKYYFLYNLLKWFSVILITWILRCLQNRKTMLNNFTLKMLHTNNILHYFCICSYHTFFMIQAFKCLKGDLLSTNNSTEPHAMSFLHFGLVCYAYFHLNISLWYLILNEQFSSVSKEV